jgi:hypothetical protein
LLSTAAKRSTISSLFSANACPLILDRYSSNHIIRICWRFAVDLLADRLYTANLQQIYSKSIVSPANPFDVVQYGQIYSKSTPCWRLAADML